MTTPENKPNPNEPKNEETIEVKKTVIPEPEEAPKKHDKMEDLFKYANSNTKDMIAYILMIMGIVLLFSSNFYGGLIIGMVFGLYFAKEIKRYASSLNDLIEQYGMVRSLVVALLILALFISAPAIFLGAAIMVAVKEMIFTE